MGSGPIVTTTGELQEKAQALADIAVKDGKVQGFGVETGPGAMCCWEISAKGVPEKA